MSKRSSEALVRASELNSLAIGPSTLRGMPFSSIHVQRPLQEDGDLGLGRGPPEALAHVGVVDAPGLDRPRLGLLEQAR